MSPADLGAAQAEPTASATPSEPSLDTTPPTRCDLAVVGGGILGLAVARELALRRPRSSICVLEREDRLATHQTGHSSGVIHAGIYYRPDSLKARLCVQGARSLYEYCRQRGIAHERCGKLVLASEARELPRLRELQRRGLANGVLELRWLDAREIESVEPYARGLAGLHSPGTGVVDFAEVARAFATDVLEAGSAVAGGCEVRAIRTSARSLRLEHARGVTEAGNAIFCAGLWADRLAVAANAHPDPRIVPFRGAYLRLRPERAERVRGLIYPTPDPALPFLGVHLTRLLDGQVLIGPTALPAAARDAYSLRTVRAADLRETLTWPGSWRMLRRFWPAGLGELHRSVSRRALVAAAARLVPELSTEDVEHGYGFAGVRAQALARDGTLLEDFAFSASERALHVRNAPSPAATASLAIARHVADRAERSFG
ncbi:MAG TPA: L-2-hydroxyglutarate oxidase [Solirubrobacteraceae bacterium]|jgi:2-hydroxyglutarate dehydrogenase|nr:L-2-hydroxyglutarate oxidase [Solirubrobacteraceae bacterium]